MRTTNLSSKERGVVAKIKSLMGKDLGTPRLLELYASVWYLLPQPKITRQDMDRVVNTMADQKPHFKGKEVQACANSISKFRNSS